MALNLDDLIARELSGLKRIQELRKVFVLGCAKSGTTWVSNLLNGHSRVVLRGEGGFAWRLTPAVLQAFQAFNKHQEQHGLGSTAMSDLDQLVAARLIIDGRMLRYVQSSGRRIDDLIAVGDKTPQHTVTLELLAQLYPAARFVHVVRDPRDAATSAWFHFGQKDGRTLEDYVRYFMTTVWPLNVASARKTGERLGRRYVEIRYEDLLSATEDKVRGLLLQLELPAQDGDVSACIEAGRFERHSGGRKRGDKDLAHFYRAGVAGDWATHLPRKVVDVCCAAIGPLMSEFGYDVDAEQSAGRAQSAPSV